jgi:glucose/arabinose dehydrogenase
MRRLCQTALCISILGTLAAAGAYAQPLAKKFGSWHDDAPGVVRKFSPDDLKAPKTDTDIEKPDNNYRAKVSSRPDGATPKVPDGFNIELFAQGLKQPRVLRVAPNGDLFLAETGSGRILIFKAGADGKPDGSRPYEFANGLTKPYGIAFYPPGDAPEFVYVGEPDKVERFPYKSGDTKAAAEPVTVVSGIPSKHHWTRDLAVSPDRKIFLSVGSGSNEGDDMPAKSVAEAQAFEKDHGLGAAWGKEDMRAAVWTFNMDGTDKKVYAHGVRNCTGLAFQQGVDSPWCVVNERDALGDDVPFEYATVVKQGSFFGWPWYYNGDHEDPRRPNQRPDLKGHVAMPDVLIQPHSAPLSIAFYDKDKFPQDYRGDAFITLHGSWNRSNRTGYKVVRMIMKDGKPTGEYADFITGFVVDDEHVWGRPVGVAVAHDGSLIVSEDGSGTMWRVTAKQ